MVHDMVNMAGKMEVGENNVVEQNKVGETETDEDEESEYWEKNNKNRNSEQILLLQIQLGMGTLLTDVWFFSCFLGATPPLRPRPRGIPVVRSCVTFGCLFFFRREEINYGKLPLT